ncbi:MAG TPA: hypothetical protein VGI81_00550 [Tepidisphaeraceae bacterium]
MARSKTVPVPVIRFSSPEFTAQGGSLQVVGEVASQADAEALRAFITQSIPPCPVVFQVLVLPASEPAARPAE